MGLNAKDIPVRFCRMIQVLFESSFTLMLKHPLISGVLLISFTVYLFLSHIYYFLVYLSPFLVCTAFFVLMFWSSEQSPIKYVKGDGKKGEHKKFERQPTGIPSNGGRNLLFERRYSLRHATSRRRNFKDKKWDVQDTIVEEKDKEVKTITGDESEFKDAKSSNKEENPSDQEEIQNLHRETLSLQSELSTSGGSALEKTSESDQQNSKSDGCSGGSTLEKTLDSDQQNRKSDGCSGGSTLEKESTAEVDEEEEVEVAEEESQDEEEELRETKKAMEWTKDDQKNLMDLGISEIERNRRLESLIARRRARQHLKQQLEKGLIDIRTVSAIQIAPLFSIKTSNSDSSRDYEIDGLEMPGSAPVFRPSQQNPFDLPYDPSEEKPNLTGDSFDQEFTMNQLKDATYCRHESFSLGPFSPFQESYPFFINGRKISDKFRRLPDKGNHDLMIEELFSKEAENCKADKHVKVSSEKAEEESRSDDDDDNKKPKKFLNFPISESGFDSPSKNQQESMFFSAFHKPSCSIASDLQVEFSEIGSPTVHADIDSMALFDHVDAEKDIVDTPRTQDIGGALFRSRGGEDDDDDASKTVHLQQIDEEEEEEEEEGDTRNHPRMKFDYRIFSDERKGGVDTEAAETSNSSSDVSSPRDHHMASSVKRALHETPPKKPEERLNHSENPRNEAGGEDGENGEDGVNNNSTDTDTDTDQRASTMVHQESMDATSGNTFTSSFSPRSVLPENTIVADQVPLPAFDRQIRRDGHTASTDHALPDHTSITPDLQTSLAETTVQPHTDGASSNSQEASGSSTIADDSNTTDRLSGPIIDDDDRNKLKNDKDKSRKGVDNEVTRGPLKVTEKISVPTSIEREMIVEELTLLANLHSPSTVSNQHSEPNKNVAEISNTEEVEEKVRNEVAVKSDKPNDSSKEGSNVHSETNKNNAEINNEKETSQTLNNPNDSSEKASDTHSESEKESEANQPEK